MNLSNHNPLSEKAGAGDFEETLRLIAKLPAPEGLEERVEAGVRARQLSMPRTARVLDFPALRPGSNWMRSAAAAAIVFVVVGGGWGVYSRVQQPQAAKVIVMPQRVGASGSFSNAGAMRTPTTLNAPVVVLPVTTKAAEANVTAPTAKKTKRRMKVGARKAAAQPIAAAK
ncbi:MAG: hypothetical protein WBQ94_11975 [Terracidiphilus sp.]